MKKIIVAIDGLKPLAGAQEYAISLAKKEGAHLVGVFLDDITYMSFTIRELVKEGGLDRQMKPFLEKDRKNRDNAVKQFEFACSKAGLNFSIHRNKNIAMHDLLHECIYADLLVLAETETFSPLKEKAPSRFVKEVLGNAQCPVFLVPRVYWPTGKVVALYDGEPSSIYAIKMMDYLMPSFKELPVEVVSLKDMDESMHVPDNKLMKEFMKRHYPAAKYTVLKGSSVTDIVNYLREQDEFMVVTLGAYGRSAFSRWIRPSLADILIRKLKMPLFVAHN